MSTPLGPIGRKRYESFVISASRSAFLWFLKNCHESDKRWALETRWKNKTARRTRQCPLVPTARQAEFLSLDCKEAFFGGAAGGAKSEALLMWLADGVTVPDYSAVVFRRTYPQLLGNDGLIAKAKRMYPAMGGTWSEKLMSYIWPGGGIIKFSHLQHEKNVDDHTGPSYHRVAFDELTHFTEYMYLFLLGRIRKAPGFPIPTGIRGASNPGNIGHHWVRRRFIPADALVEMAKLGIRDPSPPGQVFWIDGRAFVPSRLPDNPHIDQEDYISNLSHLPPVTRARMLAGDWSVVEDAIIQADWWRTYRTRGTRIIGMNKLGEEIGDGVLEGRCTRFLTLDTAGSSKERQREAKGKMKSYHCLGVWDYSREYGGFLFLRHVWRKRCEYPDLKDMVRRLFKVWKPSALYIEDATFGRPLAQDLERLGMEVHLLAPHTKSERSKGGVPGKVERSVDLQLMMEQGKVMFPEFDNQWLPEYEAELLSWRGLEDDQDDQVDITSYAARVVAGKSVPIDQTLTMPLRSLGRVTHGTRRSI